MSLNAFRPGHAQSLNEIYVLSIKQILESDHNILSTKCFLFIAFSDFSCHKIHLFHDFAHSVNEIVCIV